MTIITPTMPRTLWERLRWAAVDAWTITQRDVAHWVREPIGVAFTLLFPIMMVLMFGYLFGGAMSVPGGGDYREFLLPGMLAMTMAFGVEETMVAVSTDAAKGVTDRFRSMPMAPSAVVVGRSAADMLYSALSLLALIGCGLLIGWQWRNGVGAAMTAVALLLLLRFAMLWIGIYLGLIVRGPNTIAVVQTLVWPLAFLSNAFVAPETMPGWLGTVTEWNPLSATVSATRDLFGNPASVGTSWVAQNALLMAIVWPLLIVAIFFPLSVRRYQRLSR
ncbi:MAG: ABC transporter permease [Egibacteraceae bacterium]